MRKSFAYPILFMTLITSITVFALAFLNESTAERVATLQETELRTKILYAFDIDLNTDDPVEIERIFYENIEEETSGEERIFILKENNQDTGYAFPVSGPGLWGTINAYVAISTDYDELLGIVFVKHEETPGLGGRIEEEAFLQQFRGLNVSSAEDGNYIVYRPATNGNVDAIAGATLTSQSVANLLNQDIDIFINARKGE
ncbi:FMN-binding protein [Tissierella sp. Yu-01]|uniref:FMN-binding protein n=1 Tax=Tissierella sp. Yu-01 TaxID=3035694 RepID=UPI00240D9DFB|nr:FMN-binding protein [Tissierella sp. Yu-01]WFA09379.1 FMN-binding protein [Tissierella sp. Yu-01]